MLTGDEAFLADSDDDVSVAAREPSSQLRRRIKAPTARANNSESKTQTSATGGCSTPRCGGTAGHGADEKEESAPLSATAAFADSAAATASTAKAALIFACKVFKGADVGGDGSLTETEIRAYFKANPEQVFHLLGKDFAGWKPFFENMDTDGDGQFGVDEFINAVTKVYHSDLRNEDGSLYVAGPSGKRITYLEYVSAYNGSNNETKYSLGEDSLGLGEEATASTAPPTASTAPPADADAAAAAADAASLDEPICRICHEGAAAHSPLLQPCACSGSIANIHSDCLMAWMRHTPQLEQTPHCDLCHSRLRGLCVPSTWTYLVANIPPFLRGVASGQWHAPAAAHIFGDVVLASAPHEEALEAAHVCEDHITCILLRWTAKCLAFYACMKLGRILIGWVARIVVLVLLLECSVDQAIFPESLVVAVNDFMPAEMEQCGTLNSNILSGSALSGNALNSNGNNDNGVHGGINASSVSFIKRVAEETGRWMAETDVKALSWPTVTGGVDDFAAGLLIAGCLLYTATDQGNQPATEGNRLWISVWQVVAELLSSHVSDVEALLAHGPGWLPWWLGPWSLLPTVLCSGGTLAVLTAYGFYCVKFWSLIAEVWRWGDVAVQVVSQYNGTITRLPLVDALGAIIAAAKTGPRVVAPLIESNTGSGIAHWLAATCVVTILHAAVYEGLTYVWVDHRRAWLNEHLRFVDEPGRPGVANVLPPPPAVVEETEAEEAEEAEEAKEAKVCCHSLCQSLDEVAAVILLTCSCVCVVAVVVVWLQLSLINITTTKTTDN